MEPATKANSLAKMKQWVNFGPSFAICVHGNTDHVNDFRPFSIQISICNEELKTTPGSTVMAFKFGYTQVLHRFSVMNQINSQPVFTTLIDILKSYIFAIV